MKKILSAASALVALCLTAYGSFAQPGIDEMNQARQQLSSSFFSALDCALVMAALFGITGAVKIYHNWQMGKPRIDSDIAAWFYAAFFMVLAGMFLRAIFGI
ncbi:protein of unknown function [Mucilaginibacter pineti]|uniref:Uncharacterized protein n=1 Tax=Mucilaginibacter pineti TaxID=1391627 RepID=A0A1G7JQM2_9SPHI|nr:DUF4134 family protein [Mucilaginibacter pineti]SDF27171.1 protein of unknown function [Mucilaginibacter pineti]